MSDVYTKLYHVRTNYYYSDSAVFKDDVSLCIPLKRILYKSKKSICQVHKKIYYNLRNKKSKKILKKYNKKRMSNRYN